MANAERIEIDFNNASWQRDLGEINYDKIKEIELVNYNSNVSLSELLNFTALQDVYFRKSEIKKLPPFLKNMELNLISFVETSFIDETINSALVKSAKRISIYGSLTTYLPTDILSFTGIEYIFIRNTSITNLTIPNVNLLELKELTIQSNEQLVEISGKLGSQESLTFLDIFGNPKLNSFNVSKDNHILKLRIGSWSNKTPIHKEFHKIKMLKEIIIDNYISETIDINFLKHQNIEKMKIYCPTEDNILTISSLENLNDLRINRRVKCQDEILVYTGLHKLNELEFLELNLGGFTSKEALANYIGNFKSLKKVKLVDTNCLLYTSPSPRDRG